MCVVLLDGVEDHTADTAGVAAAQTWGGGCKKKKITFYPGYSQVEFSG